MSYKKQKGITINTNILAECLNVIFWQWQAIKQFFKKAFSHHKENIHL